MAIGRRTALLSSMTLLMAACARLTPRPGATLAPVPAYFDAWNQEAQAILSDALETLRTFDTFQAFRVSTADSSGMRLGSELAWDPPVTAAWDEGIHVTRGLRGRADQLLQAITTTTVDPGVWREQRALADATHDLVDLGDALSAYRDRVQALPPGDASTALPLLDRAWAQWEGAAARWGISRAELISCASVA